MPFLPFLVAVALGGPAPAIADPSSSMRRLAAPSGLGSPLGARDGRTDLHGLPSPSQTVIDDDEDPDDGGGEDGGGDGGDAGGGDGGDAGGGGGDGPTGGTAEQQEPTPVMPALRKAASPSQRGAAGSPAAKDSAQMKSATAMRAFLGAAQAIIAGDFGGARSLLDGFEDKVAAAYDSAPTQADKDRFWDMWMGAINCEVNGTLSYRGYTILPGGILAPKDATHSDFGDLFRVGPPVEGWLKKLVDFEGDDGWSDDEALAAFDGIDNEDYFDDDEGGWDDGVEYVDFGDVYFFSGGSDSGEFAG